MPQILGGHRKRAQAQRALPSTSVRGLLGTDVGRFQLGLAALHPTGPTQPRRYDRSEQAEWIACTYPLVLNAPAISWLGWLRLEGILPQRIR